MGGPEPLLRKASLQPSLQVLEPVRALASLVGFVVVPAGYMAGRVAVTAAQLSQARQLSFAHLDHGLGPQVPDARPQLLASATSRARTPAPRTELAESAADLLGAAAKHL